MGYTLIKSKEKEQNQISYNYDDNTIQHLQESSDVSQTIKELNDDKVNNDSFSNIDMKSRLAPIEISSILALDSLVALDFLPKETSFITRSKKRLAVSQDGAGRIEIVQIAQGMKDNATGRSVWDRIGNVFSGGKQ